MNEGFRGHLDSLPPKLTVLLAVPPLTVTTLPRLMPSRGVYLFSDGDVHLYVGRTNTLKGRIRNHCRPGSRHTQAAFAFRPAREATGNLRATYKTQSSRAGLPLDPLFAQAFMEAKARLRQPRVRYVEEPNTIRQCLLGIYIAVTLNARHNDFDKH